MEKKDYVITEEFAGIRLDKAISMKDTSISRASVQRMIDEELILVNGNKTKASYKVQENISNCHLPHHIQQAHNASQSLIIYIDYIR